MFKTNNQSKILEEVWLINGGGITSIQVSSDEKFCIASGVNNSLRIYDWEFKQLVSEVKT